MHREDTANPLAEPGLFADYLSRGAGVIARRRLRGVIHGGLQLRLPGGLTVSYGASDAEPQAVIEIHRMRGLWRILRRGTLGFAESYVAGDLVVPDLAAVFRFFLTNKQAFTRVERGMPGGRAPDRVRHLLRRNTVAGSRRNIVAHYDLGNAFYAGWLDRGMTYSSAWFEDDQQSLEAAQEAKYRRVFDGLDVPAGGRVLEIGCGWGGFAEHAMQRDDVDLTGITLSPAQLAYAQRRIEEHGLAQRCDLRLEDYRETRGSFDAIASIEMMEAVGEENWPTYFDRIRELLKPGGRAVLQVITISEDLFETYRRRPDFIQRHIFPGGMLPTVTAIAEHSQAAGLNLKRRDMFGASYARTLWQWREQFLSAWPELRPLGFDERFRRLWDYYLTYCAVGFEEGTIDVGLYHLEKPA